MRELVNKFEHTLTQMHNVAHILFPENNRL